MAGTNKGINALQVRVPDSVFSCFDFSPLLWICFSVTFLQHIHSSQADIKIPGLPLKIVMEAIQQATGKTKMDC